MVTDPRWHEHATFVVDPRWHEDAGGPFDQKRSKHLKRSQSVTAASKASSSTRAMLA